MNKKLLTLSAFSAIISFICGFVLIATDLTDELASEREVLTFFSILSIISYMLFMLGFVHIGKANKSISLIISSYILSFIGSFSVLLTYLSNISQDWANFYDKPIVIILFVVSFGLFGVMHGYGVLNLKNIEGKSAKQAGWLEILMSISLLTFVLSPLALLLVIPMYFSQTKLLFKARG